jgi:hypothetical protein
VRNSKTANFGLDANNAGAGGTVGGSATDPGVVGSSAYNENPTPGHSQTGVYAGIQHSF